MGNGALLRADDKKLVRSKLGKLLEGGAKCGKKAPQEL